MMIARVVGSAVATVKDDKLIGLKLLVVREVTPANELVGKPLVAIDAVGAGAGELVLIASGSSAGAALAIGWASEAGQRRARAGDPRLAGSRRRADLRQELKGGTWLKNSILT